MTAAPIVGDFSGRRPPHPEITHPRMHASEVLTAGYTGAVPAVVDWFSGVNLPMALNSSLGDCVIADISHAIEVWTKLAQGIETMISDNDVLTTYERVSGYVPGNPSTDRGCVIQDALNDWRKIGTAGHTILAFLQVDYNNLAELKACCWLFGGVTLGVNFPQSAMDQFRAGLPWDFVSNASAIIGGHDVRLLGVDASGMMNVATWGAIQKMTPAFLAHYVVESWAEADGEWIKNNASPTGLNVPALNAAFQQITGQPGPFPVSPVPPSPTPVPPGALSAADKTLAAAIPRNWLDHPHLRFADANKVADALKSWLIATGQM